MWLPIYRGSSIHTTYLPKEDDRSTESQLELLMYGKNTRNQGPRHTARPVTFQDRSVSFRRPGWEANNARHENTTQRKGIIYHTCYTPEDNYTPECTLNLRDKIEAITKFKALTEWQTCLLYLYYIIIFSKDMESHLKHAEEILSALDSANITIKCTKREFFTQKVRYMGHITEPGKFSRRHYRQGTWGGKLATKSAGI